MQLTSIVKLTAACWANLTVKTSIDGMDQHFESIIIYNLKTLWSIFWRMYLYVLLTNNVVMKETIHEDGTKAAKTPLMIYYAKLNDNILWKDAWQNERQWRVNNFWSGIIGNLRGNWLRPFINAVFARFIGKRERHTLPATFRKWASTEHRRILIL